MGKRIKRHTKIEHIPQDIIDDILVNLPVKSLLRFKCVSKSWRSLISSNHFTKEHLKNSSGLIRHNLMYSSYIDAICSHTLRSCSLKSFLDEQNPIVTTSCHDSLTPNPICYKYIVGSCNGLILIRSGINLHWRHLILWNPSTREVKIILPPPYARRALYRKSDHFVYGFGYDDSTDDYKVVCIFVSDPRPYTTQMYSLRTNSWKKIESFGKGHLKRCSATHVNGKLHWFAYENKIIVSLSLADGTYDIIAPPRWFSKIDRCYILNNIGGYLCLVSDGSKFPGTTWVMMKYGEVESWTNIWKIWEFSGPMGPIDGPDQQRPIWLTKNGDVVVGISDSGSRVVVSNKKSRTSRVYGIDVQIDRHNIYVESLVSPYKNLASDHTLC